MSLPYSSSTPADDPMKKEECHKAAKAVRKMLEMVSRLSFFFWQHDFIKRQVFVSVGTCFRNVLGVIRHRQTALLLVRSSIEACFTLEGKVALVAGCIEACPTLEGMRPVGSVVAVAGFFFASFLSSILTTAVFFSCVIWSLARDHGGLAMPKVSDPTKVDDTK